MQGYELVSEWFKNEPGEREFSALERRLEKLKEKGVIAKLLFGDKRSTNSKTGDFRFIIRVLEGSKETALQFLDEFHFLGVFKLEEQGPSARNGRTNLAAPMSRHSHREEDLLASWEKERKKLLADLKQTQDELTHLTDAEQEARFGKIRMQRELEAELFALRKEKKCWELERQQLSQAMALLREELEELKGGSSRPAVAVEAAAKSVCIDCKNAKELSEYSASQKRKKASERRCKMCAHAENARH